MAISKRILVVSHDLPLRESRVALLEAEGYTVESVNTDDAAMAILETTQFDLILLGRKSNLPKRGIDQRVREKYPALLTLKIEEIGVEKSVYPSRITDAAPVHVIVALREMLGDGMELIPLK